MVDFAMPPRQRQQRLDGGLIHPGLLAVDKRRQRIGESLMGVNAQARARSGTVIGIDTESQKQVVLGDEEKQSGVIVRGRTGYGKTTLLANMILQDIRRGFGVCYMSINFDVFPELLSRIPASRRPDVILLDVRETSHAVGINPLHCPDLSRRDQVVSKAMHIFKRLWDIGPHTPQLENVLRKSLYTLIYHGLTLAEMPLLLQDKTYRDRLVASLPEEGTWYHIKAFWEHFALLSQRLQEERTDSTYNKVVSFLEQQVTERIFGQTRQTIDFQAVLDSGKILFVPLIASGARGVGEESVRLLGTVILSLLLDAAENRIDLPLEERRMFSAYFDEFHLYATSDMETMVNQLRKQKFAITLACQYSGQIDEVKLQRATKAMATIVALRQEEQDAQEWARLFAKPSPKGPPQQVQATKPVTVMKVRHLWDNLTNKKQYEAMRQEQLARAAAWEKHTAFAKDALEILTSLFPSERWKWLLSEEARTWTLQPKAPFRYPDLHASIYFHPVFSDERVQEYLDGHRTAVQNHRQVFFPNTIPCVLEIRLENQFSLQTEKKEAITFLLIALQLFRRRLYTYYTYSPEGWISLHGDDSFVPHSIFAIKKDILTETHHLGEEEAHWLPIALPDAYSFLCGLHDALQYLAERAAKEADAVAQFHSSHTTPFFTEEYAGYDEPDFRWEISPNTGYSRDIGFIDQFSQVQRYKWEEGQDLYKPTDMIEFMAKELAHLERGEAYCYVEDFTKPEAKKKQKVTLLPLAYTTVSTVQTQQIIREVQARTRARYCRPSGMIEEEIRQRRQFQPVREQTVQQPRQPRQSQAAQSPAGTSQPARTHAGPPPRSE